MATLDGIELFDSAPTSGAAFLLTAAVREPLCLVHDGWTSEARCRYIIVRKTAVYADYSATRDSAFSAAQQALDLASMSRLGDLAIRDASKEHLTWWPKPSGQVVRISFLTTLLMGVGSTVEHRDASGAVVPSTPPPAVVWHDSGRYYRRSQTTDDLFDSFRNLYLALESILDYIAPQGANEYEGQWFRRALAVAHRRINLTRFAPRGMPDPISAVHRQLYTDTRNLLFHAKGSRPRYIPQGAASEKESVTEVVRNLSALYQSLAAHEFNARTPTGFVFPAMFEPLREGLKADLRLHVTDDPTRAVPESTVLNPAGGAVVDLMTRHAPEFDAPGRCGFVGTMDDPMSKLAKVATLAATVKGKVLALGNLDGVLTLERIAQLQGHIGIGMANDGQPKERFAM